MFIGITTRIIYEDGIKKQFVNEAYIEYVKLAGFTPIILPMLTDIDDLLNFDITIDVMWVGKQYTITYITNGGDIEETINCCLSFRWMMYLSVRDDRKVPKERHPRRAPRVPSLGNHPPDLRENFTHKE